MIKSRKKAFVLASSIIFTVSLILISWLTFESGASLAEAFFNFAYNIGDAILIILMVFIALLAIQYNKGKLFWPWIAFIFALLAMFLGDLLFFLYTLEYEKGDNFFYLVTEMAFVASYLLFAFSLFNIGLITRSVGKNFLNKSKEDQESLDSIA
jgi:cytochrome bd-type quinol oxidase subunit 2